MFDFSTKIILIGESSTGKTQLLWRYLFDNNTQFASPTIGVDCFCKEITHEEKIVQANFWDSCGAEQFRSVSSYFYRGSDVGMVLFDISNSLSFSKSIFWINEFKKYAHASSLMYFVGNKIDLKSERKVELEGAQKFASYHDFKYFEVSAKTGEGVNDMFESIIGDVVKQHDKQFRRRKPTTTLLKNVKLFEEMNGNYGCGSTLTNGRYFKCC